MAGCAPTVRSTRYSLGRAPLGIRYTTSVSTEAGQPPNGLRGKQKRKFRATTNSKHVLPVAPNLLNQDFTATAPNRAWWSDIPYIAADEGWLYLAALKDLFSGEPVG